MYSPEKAGGEGGSGPSKFSQLIWATSRTWTGVSKVEEGERGEKKGEEKGEEKGGRTREERGWERKESEL